MRRRANAELMSADERQGTDPPERDICGFRLLRRIHAGERTHAYLASAPDEQLAVLRLFRRQDADVTAATELAMEDAVSSAHISRSFDVGASSRDEPILVTERLGERLSHTLERDGLVAAGSIVSLLAPIVSTCAELHAAGLAHGSVNAAHIRFADDGRPVLTGADGGLPASPSACRDDLRGFSAVASLVLARTDPDTRARGMRDIVAWVADECDSPELLSDGFYSDLECRVFALADPLPFALAVGQAAVAEEVPLRRQRELRQRDDDRSVISAVLAGEFGFSIELLRQLVADVAGKLAGVKRRRRLIGLGVAVFLIGLVASLVLLPSDVQAEPAPSTSTPRAHSPLVIPETGTLPVDALSALLPARLGCMRAADSECLSGVYEAGSPAAEADAAALRAGKADPFPVLSLPEDDRKLGSAERHGEAVIIRVSAISAEITSASVLLLETEAGWVIRDVFPA